MLRVHSARVELSDGNDYIFSSCLTKTLSAWTAQGWTATKAHGCDKKELEPVTETAAVDEKPLGALPADAREPAGHWQSGAEAGIAQENTDPGHSAETFVLLMRVESSGFCVHYFINFYNIFNILYYFLFVYVFVCMHLKMI